METLWRVRCFTTITGFPLPARSQIPRLRRPVSNVTHSTSSLNTTTTPSPAQVSQSIEEEALKEFLKERKLNGDFVSKVTDMIWSRGTLNLVEVDADDEYTASAGEPNQVSLSGSDEDSGFLKLAKTQEWVSGDTSAPRNKKANAKKLQDDREKRKKLNFLKYNALKKELMSLSVGIGIACSGYCLFVLSVQAAVSYAVGVLFSCLYLQLLYQHADSISSETVPQIFRRKKTKKIGIRSEDLSDLFERSIKGSSIALSSPRLVIPAAIYGLWALSHQYIGTDLFDFQIVPAMFGLFAYKAAALVQVYRDNEDLRFVFPENEGESR